MMKVYVKSKSEKWLMPTNPANARILLKEKRANVVQRTPFTIQLCYPTTGYTQPVTVGIDDGGICVGIAAVSNGRPLYQEELVLRKDIKAKLDTRRQYRRSRRHRKTRYRKARFLNRRASIPRCKVCGGNASPSKIICRACLRAVNGVHQRYAHVKQSVFKLPPSIKAKKDAILLKIKRIPLPVPTTIRLEDAYFDFQAMENPEIRGAEYQHGDLFYHKNYKQACLVRDGFQCRMCGEKENLEIHHIKPLSQGGTNKLSNLMALCLDCHVKHHKKGLKLPRQKNVSYRSAAHAQQGKNYLQVSLSRIASLKTTFGYLTAHHRNQAGIEKSHVNDAVIIADPKALPLPWQIRTNQVASRKRSLHEATARKGRKIPNRTQKRNNKNVFTLKGFNRWDTVRYRGRVGLVSGFTGTGGCRIVNIEGRYITNPNKKFNQVNLSEVTRLHGNQGYVSALLPTNSKAIPPHG